ncbi:unnamed protein product [Meloidogyne enterolobii]|uniref:Uncharacterized protein n=1 Tax=Meloidogyne enterolobii TaxID=390850 RepID=A0ACB0XN66_MELEN
MMKAAEDLKKQQMLKEQERQSVLNERIVPLPELESSGEDELQRISKEFAESVIRLEREKYDLSYTVRQKDFEINELTIAVNDLRGKLFGIFKMKFFYFNFIFKCKANIKESLQSKLILNFKLN